MSAAAKKRIAAGQKKRWAAFHANDTKPVAAKKAAPKRKMSPERKAALVANLAKARAARAAKRGGLPVSGNLGSAALRQVPATLTVEGISPSCLKPSIRAPAA
jgi:hypothetical protein